METNSETPKDYINNIDQKIRDGLSDKGIDPTKQKTVLTVGWVQKRQPRLIEVATPEGKILPRITPKKIK